jgi:hypothetical protein
VPFRTSVQMYRQRGDPNPHQDARYKEGHVLRGSIGSCDSEEGIGSQRHRNGCQGKPGPVPEPLSGEPPRKSSVPLGTSRPVAWTGTSCSAQKYAMNRASGGPGVRITNRTTPGCSTTQRLATDWEPRHQRRAGTPAFPRCRSTSAHSRNHYARPSSIDDAIQRHISLSRIVAGCNAVVKFRRFSRHGVTRGDCRRRMPHRR